MDIPTSVVEHVAQLLHVDTDVLSISSLRKGMLVELEHGTHNAQKGTHNIRANCIDSITNITNDDLIMTAKIALAHFAEGLNYYEYLEEMEQRMEKDRGSLPFVDIFLPDSCINSCLEELKI